MALVDLATCLLKDLSKRLLTDCSSECPDESNKEIIEDFRLTESLLSQFFMIRACAEAEGEDPDYSKIELALNNLIEKYQCLGCQTYTGEPSSGGPGDTMPEDCDISFTGPCSDIKIIPGANVVSISYDDGSGDTGIPCPLATNGNIGNQIGNTLDTKYLCISDSPTKEEEACNMTQVNENTLVYIYYDGSSLGVTEVQDAYDAIMDWLNSQPGFTAVTATPTSISTGVAPNTINPGENVFHSIMAGERWLDWGMQPITGEFNNLNITENPADALWACSYITQGDEDKGQGRVTCTNLPTKISNWSYSEPGIHQFYDTVTGSFLGEDVGNWDHYNSIGPCSDLCDPLGTPCDGNPFVAWAAGLNKWAGPPPAAAVTNDVLVIIFADESDCMYHGEGNNKITYVQRFDDRIASHCTACEDAEGSDAEGFYDDSFGIGRVHSPTGIWKRDYGEYTSQYTSRQVDPTSGTYRAFIYPSCPGSLYEKHLPFPLHVAASIDSGDNTITPDGLFDAVNLPTSSMYRSGLGCGGNSSNSPADPLDPNYDPSAPAGAMVLLRGVYTNPYYPGFGGLDQYGWGYNSEMLDFDSATFETDLEAFLSEGVWECGGLDCLDIRVLESDNPTIPVVGEIIKVDGVDYTTDGTGWINIPTVAPGAHTIGYANSECYTLTTAGECIKYILTVYKDTETFDACLSFSDVQCGCGPDGGLTPDIVIHVGSTIPDDPEGDGIIGTITNETTGVVTNITVAMVSGPDGDGNYIVTVPFENTPNDDIPDGRYTILLYGIGNPFVEYKECRLILCESATIIQDLFKKFVSNKECCPCEKPFEDFVQAYALFRALKVVGVNDCEYETFIDENITKLHALLVTAKAGNCKDC
tara:strand:- start:1618 stop:4224 length:2607 start_codon:yes stop_codon:yes gene_type:complete